MLHLKLISVSITLTFVISALVPGQAFSQSGRGRPRVPVREPSAAPPPPKIPEATTVIKKEQSGSVSRFMLRNGMTVIINEQHAVPLVTSVACFKVGYREEPPDEKGIALLLQRAVLGGAPRNRSSSSSFGDPAAILRGRTAFDRTSFELTTQPQQLKEALASQAEMLQSPSISPGQLSQELDALAEELKWLGGAPAVEIPGKTTFEIYGAPGAYSMARLAAMSSGGRTAGNGFINVNNLRSLSREQLAEFYRTQYRPEKLIIAVVGDVLTFNILVQIQQLYGDFGVSPRTAPPIATGKADTKAKPEDQKGAITVRVPSASPSLTQKEVNTGETQPQVAAVSLRYENDRGENSQSIVTVGYRVPGLNSRDWAAVEVLSALLGHGRGSRLYRSFVDGQVQFSQIESCYLGFKDDGLLLLQANLDPALLDKVESTIFRELDRVRQELAAEVEIARAKSLLEQRFLLATTGHAGKAEALVRGEASAGSYRSALDYRDLIRAVRAEDVQRVASEYLSLSTTTIHEFESRHAPARSFDAERFAATVTAWAPSFAKPVDPKQIKPSSGSLPPVLTQGSERSAQQQSALESVEAVPVKDFSTLNGPRALVREDHSQPLVSIAVLFQGGRAIEDQGNSGITELMLRSLLYGTTSRSASDVAYELEQLGADVQVIAELDYFGLAMNALSRNADRVLKLVATLIEQPAFREEDVLRARQEQLGWLQQARDSADVRSFELLMQSMLPGHPYSLPRRGREEVIAKLTAEQLREWHERTVKRQLPLAVIVGDTDGSALVSGQLVDAFRRRELDRAVQIKVPQPQKPAEKTEVRTLPFSFSAIGYPAAKGDAIDLTVIAAVDSLIFGGSQHIGDEGRGSGVNGYGKLGHEALLVAGLLYVRLMTSPATEAAARSWVTGRFERAARGDIAAPEFVWASTIAAIETLSSLQDRETRAFEYARALFYGRQPSEVDTINTRLAKLTVDDLKRVAGQYIKRGAAFAGVVRGTSPQSTPPPKQTRSL